MNRLLYAVPIVAVLIGCESRPENATCILDSSLSDQHKDDVIEGVTRWEQVSGLRCHFVAESHPDDADHGEIVFKMGRPILSSDAYGETRTLQGPWPYAGIRATIVFVDGLDERLWVRAVMHETAHALLIDFTDRSPEPERSDDPIHYYGANTDSVVTPTTGADSPEQPTSIDIAEYNRRWGG